jgi:hypothetical protein
MSIPDRRLVDRLAGRPEIGVDGAAVDAEIEGR